MTILVRSISDNISKNLYEIKFNFLIISFVVIMYLFNIFYLKYIDKYCFFIFFNCYFNDILAGTLIISIINFLYLTIDKHFIELKQIFFIVLIVGLIWEYCPFLPEDSIADVYDLIAYQVGGLLYREIYRVIEG